MAKQKQLGSQAELAGSLGEYLAETLQQASKRLNDDSPQGSLARGQVFQMAGYFSEAVESYTEALMNDDEMDEATARLVVTQLGSHQPEKALANAMKLAARNPGFELKEMSSNQCACAMTLLGDALAHNDRPNDAIEAYRVARSISKRDAFAAGRLAQLYLATGEPKKAVEQVKDVGANPRFRDLSRILALGNRSASLLPIFQRGSISAILDASAHGRPLFVEGTPRLAALVHGNDQWCADVGDSGLGQR